MYIDEQDVLEEKDKFWIASLIQLKSSSDLVLRVEGQCEERGKISKAARITNVIAFEPFTVNFSS